MARCPHCGAGGCRYTGAGEWECPECGGFALGRQAPVCRVVSSSEPLGARLALVFVVDGVCLFCHRAEAECEAERCEGRRCNYCSRDQRECDREPCRAAAPLRWDSGYTPTPKQAEKHEAARRGFFGERPKRRHFEREELAA